MRGLGRGAYIGWEGETEENVCDIEVNLFDTDVVLWCILRGWGECLSYGYYAEITVEGDFKQDYLILQLSIARIAKKYFQNIHILHFRQTGHQPGGMGKAGLLCPYIFPPPFSTLIPLLTTWSSTGELRFSLYLDWRVTCHQMSKLPPYIVPLSPEGGLKFLLLQPPISAQQFSTR